MGDTSPELMRRCAFLTLDEKGDFVIDDEHAYPPLSARGWRVDTVPWNRPGVDWDKYALVVIRSTWDYQKDPHAFLDVLQNIENSAACLENPRNIVVWNLSKTYLRDLENRGVTIVPTAWLKRLRNTDLAGLFDRLKCPELVIKPQVGANADGAFRLKRPQAGSPPADLLEYYQDLPLMAQPFVPHIQAEGEYSLFFFNGRYSHAVLKTPKAGDFRCQEEHGAAITTVAVEPALKAAGDAAVQAVRRALLYARADFIRSLDGENWWLMELELIEPSLYLRMDPAAPERFAAAIDALMSQRARSMR